ncbi:MAG TPA: maleylpyruvate isomerase family mycothiol-dependent enzyme [Candidatus Nanopelagicales bacterium]|nr:maleylpyruvate isomerase family mycothiol-dependent enzyme [Candidatus Nanopelagicales bacterium]
MSNAADAALWAHVAAERRDIVELLEGLGADEWLVPSLCEGWRVRDVAAHLLIDDPVRELGVAGVLGRMVRWRFDVDRANQWWVQHNADVPVSTLTARMARSVAPGPVSRVLGPANQLRAAVIHHQDMRRPLGRGSTVPAGRLRATLDAVLTRSGSANLGARQRARGIRLTASDLDWSAGDGPEV